ncbi:GNAT family N-acetyltransferase [Burkholderia orbicola]|uniref:GCN5-related N-acetyltransferase n=1 Tax=Burkholderia orbicola (strain AU 1054) TaxID=331271 RepID=A0A0H2XTN6_BURO1|nr:MULTISPECIES: GNAT family N-acetyltransferase [Burkholderia]EKS9842204.1 GNAT family N-acetyltransferase [Burkholderia cepacia]ABK11655.1 GCN5-related N-acetyltransferase [Burkholderia cenocepacia HI2424]MBJ9671673.1 GNAT family N-acetyltransferase [Burkholderia cenocepacia]MBJ9877770.1 GNAT family N-acetyltransferase [Burkholderia cenocepacia]MBJ9925248.1 GNAT family N-acetyltransferase [Burkholderia cenocepacia]
MTLTYAVTDAADAEVRKQIVAPLVRFNERQAGPADFRPLAVIVTDAAGAVVGGLWGGTAFGWLHVDLLVVPEAARGQGAGTRIMDLAEREAVARGCHSAWLDTFDFQARPFYEKRGYVRFGELPDYPVGHTRIFLTKKLAG